jgi:hypothetical protein
MTLLAVRMPVTARREGARTLTPDSGRNSVGTHTVQLSWMKKALARGSPGRHVVVRTARGLRVCLVAVLLAAVGILDAKTVDFVATDGGDLVTRLPQAETLSATGTTRPDVCAATRTAPFLATPESPRPVRRPVATRAEISTPNQPRAWRASEPLPARAPPTS